MRHVSEMYTCTCAQPCLILKRNELPLQKFQLFASNFKECCKVRASVGCGQFDIGTWETQHPWKMKLWDCDMQGYNPAAFLPLVPVRSLSQVTQKKTWASPKKDHLTSYPSCGIGYMLWHGVSGQARFWTAQRCVNLTLGTWGKRNCLAEGSPCFFLMLSQLRNEFLFLLGIDCNL